VLVLLNEIFVKCFFASLKRCLVLFLAMTYSNVDPLAFILFLCLMDALISVVSHFGLLLCCTLFCFIGACLSVSRFMVAWK